jgi:hypothetical protein
LDLQAPFPPDFFADFFFALAILITSFQLHQNFAMKWKIAYMPKQPKTTPPNNAMTIINSISV